jgi:glycine cleavage system H protein
MKKYTPSHEWIQVQDNLGTVGITQYAQGELGEIVYVDLPVLNKKLMQGEESAVLESTKAAADIYAPVTGQVVEINTSLVQNPSLLNTAPESDGWIYKMQLQEHSQLEDLLSEEQYLEMIQG